MTLRVSVVDPRTDPQWQQLLERPEAGLFHSPPWLNAIAETYGFSIRACVACEDERPVGGIALAEIDDLAGRRIVSLPFSDTCNPLLSRPDVGERLLETMRADGAPIHLRLLDAPFTPAGFAVAKAARWHRLEVNGSEADQVAVMAPGTRRAISKAERLGVEIRPLRGGDGLRGFMDLHVQVRRRKYGMLAQPPAFFEAIRRNFAAGDLWHPLGAYLDGRLVAAVVYLRWRDCLYYKFNASAADALHARPNNLLVLAGTRLAHSLGCRTLDLGASDDDQPGLIRFKRNSGAVETEVRHLRWTPPAWSDRRGDEARAVLGSMARAVAMSDASDATAEQVSALAYRYFA